ncbi:unnamed protein product [Bursaphelenchus xylophilus]|nr:unnamed protein product [Bursaphelenchus xylophilus]CAG9099708.1 unnamed protein product [Bursaphelenchus xylophilus]
MKIRRGSWFYADTMQPVAEELAEAIEKHHLEKFRNQMIPDSPVFNENEVNKKPVLTMLKWEEHDEVRWNSVIDVSFYNNTKANRLFRFVTRGKGVFPLKRGFSSEASIDEGMPNFSDLILVVHGIGQKGYENLIAKNTTQIREVMDHLMDKYHSHEKRRPMILPIEWRSSLVLDEGVTDTITLPRMPQVRSALNSIAMDIMYYQSPLYRTEIVNGVIRCLNVTYTKFVKNNPNFNGAVSIFAHSLGSVIAYDIITNWSPLLLYDEFVTNAIEHRKNEAEDDEQRKLFTDFYECRRKILEQDGHMQEILLRRDEDLKFKVKNLFCIGSPLGVFIIMRGANAEQLLPKKEQCERIYNIFHPYDPVAYRLEPMYHENYKNIRPIKLFAYNEVNRDYNKLGYDCHRSYLKKIKKAQKKEAAASGEKTGDSDEKRKGEEEEDEDSDSGDCSSIHSPDIYSGPSPRSESPIGPEDIQENMGNGNTNTPLKVETQSRWWRFGSTTGEKKPKEDGVKEKEEKPEFTLEIERKEDKIVLSPAEQLIDGIPQEKRVPYRIDFQLQTSLTDKSYWSVLKSHFGYWTNYDVTAFLINQLYPPIISEPSPKV